MPIGHCQSELDEEFGVSAVPQLRSPGLGCGVILLPPEPAYVTCPNEWCCVVLGKSFSVAVPQFPHSSRGVSSLGRQLWECSCVTSAEWCRVVGALSLISKADAGPSAPQSEVLGALCGDVTSDLHSKE